jgi:hypothetical protein
MERCVRPITLSFPRYAARFAPPHLRSVETIHTHRQATRPPLVIRGLRPDPCSIPEGTLPRLVSLHTLPVGASAASTSSYIDNVTAMHAGRRAGGGIEASALPDSASYTASANANRFFARRGCAMKPERAPKSMYGPKLPCQGASQRCDETAE